MKNIGLQMYSINDAVEKDLLGSLEKVAQMGYTGAQFAGFYDVDAESVKKKLDELNMKPAGAHVQIHLLEDQLNETLKYHDTIENNLIIVPWLPEEMRTTEDDYKRTAEKLDQIGQKLHARGFTLGYHNHDFEFNQFDGKTGLEIIFENTDPKHLKMELDCFWAAYTDNHPVDVIDKYSDRCITLHIKDMKEDGDQHISTELGTGQLPLSDYITKGQEVGVDWLIVEQEHFSQDPLESAKENAAMMKKLVKA